MRRISACNRNVTSVCEIKHRDNGFGNIKINLNIALAVVEDIALVLVEKFAVEILVHKNSQVLTVPELVADKINRRIVLLQCPVNCLFVESDRICLRLAGPETVKILRTHGV
jgi:hypothetical protein